MIYFFDGRKKNQEKECKVRTQLHAEKNVDIYLCFVDTFMQPVCYLKIPIVFVSPITVLIRLIKQNLRRTTFPFPFVFTTRSVTHAYKYKNSIRAKLNDSIGRR